jgi:snurportin-1
LALSSGEHVLKKLKERYTFQHHKTAAEASTKSLELLRMNIQAIFDREVDQVIRRFVQSFFEPAIKNIKENLGDASVPESHCCGWKVSLLENAKVQYLSYAASLSRANTPVMEITSDSESSTENTSILHQALKRKRVVDEPETGKKLMLTSMVVSSAPALQISATAAPKHVVWATSNITEHCSFVLDYKVGRTLGIPDLRDRLANKHPELIRYPVDDVDREWLVKQKHLSPLTNAGKPLLLVLQEVEALADREYSKAHVGDLQKESFLIPDIMYKKMQLYFSGLNERSRELMMQAKGSPDTGTPTKMSSLSSSHATLTALLSAPGE